WVGPVITAGWAVRWPSPSIAAAPAARRSSPTGSRSAASSLAEPMGGMGWGRGTMSITIDLSGRTALVTGSWQGIGAEIARVLHRAGARLILNHPDRSGGQTHEDALALLDELLALRAQSAILRVADVSDPASVEAMMQSIRQEWGGLDILVNNAGILRDRSIAKMTLDEWRSVLDVDLSGVFFCCKFGLEVLRDGGSIVSVGSLAAKMGFHGQSNYAAAKAGVQALTRVLARECARRSIRVNAVAPG